MVENMKDQDENEVRIFEEKNFFFLKIYEIF